MKKLIALLLTLALALGCAAAFGEGALSTVTSVDGSFSISFQLPEGTELLSGAWDDSGDLYQANLKGQNGLFYYLAVAAPVAAEGEEGETAPVTFNEDNGYTDEYMLSMINDLYADDGKFDAGIQTTAYGTKLAVVRFTDPEAPSAYIFSKWNDYEIGVNVFSVDADGAYRQITDEQVQHVVDFLSEVWMSNTDEVQAPAA